MRKHIWREEFLFLQLFPFPNTNTFMLLIHYIFLRFLLVEAKVKKRIKNASSLFCFREIIVAQIRLKDVYDPRINVEI